MLYPIQNNTAIKKHGSSETTANIFTVSPGSEIKILGPLDFHDLARIIAAGSTLALIGLTCGGVHYPWGDAHVLGPLITGLALIGAFFVYEFFFYRYDSESQRTQDASTEKLMHPATFPLDILNNRTSAFA